MAKTILIVEDDLEIQDLLSFTVSRAGFKSKPVNSSEEAIRSLDSSIPELIIADWMLPGMNGIDLARFIRSDDLLKDIPIIMLTALGEESSKLRSFEIGVDDYVTKPFSPNELIARIKAILRRTGVRRNKELDLAGIKLDLTSQRLFANGKEVKISPTEFKLLELFMKYPNRAFDRSQLLDRVWGRGVFLDDRTVDVHVLRLRKTLKPVGCDHLIETVRGVGYRLAAL